MPEFHYTFTVAAPRSAVSAFHHDTRVLKKLTPPPIYVQIHSFEPLGEGSRAEFTMWFGPLPAHWVAVHNDVSEAGFTDRQLEGPLGSWEHKHRFTVISESLTRVDEEISYEYDSGLWGILGRLLFNRLGLYALFTARKFITRWYVQRASRTAVA